jgi:hypothetical protein
MTAIERVPSFPPLSFSRLTVTTVTAADGGNDSFKFPTAAALPLLLLQLLSEIDYFVKGSVQFRSKFTTTPFLHYPREASKLNCLGHPRIDMLPASHSSSNQLLVKPYNSFILNMQKIEEGDCDETLVLVERQDCL